MAKKLAASFVSLVYEAAVKSYWRRKAFARFLRQHGLSESFLTSWDASESKRDLLDRVFSKLPTQAKGEQFILSLARDLAQQKSFPDLRGWENTEELTREATVAVGALRIALEQLDHEVVSERDRREAQERVRAVKAEGARTRASLALLETRLTDLAKQLGSQGAGYFFQDWFFDLMDFAEVVNRRPYVVAGRQIDGSITISGTTYLVELKFTTPQAAATDIDTFHKKVTDKADNTMGVMVSISGYSTTAIQEASKPKTPLLLLDHNHLFLVLTGVATFPEIVDRARRHASQTSESYLGVTHFNV